jgi:hypothetical protein
MKELLTQLQLSKKTWEKFVEYVNEKPVYHWDGFNIMDWRIGGYEHNRIIEVYELNGLLTSFCDGEGYAVCPQIKVHKPIWVYEINEIRYTPRGWTSRQEAFNAGVKKAFELMEKK